MITTIKKRADFVSATDKGKRFITSAFILQMHKRNDEHPAGTETRIGFTVTKKMGNAVIRNRIKRRLREAVRAIAEPHAVPGHDYVLVSRHKSLDCPYSELVRDMKFAFSRITSMKDGNPKKPYTKRK